MPTNSRLRRRAESSLCIRLKSGIPPCADRAFHRKITVKTPQNEQNVFHGGSAAIKGLIENSTVFRRTVILRCFHGDFAVKSTVFRWWFQGAAEPLSMPDLAACRPMISRARRLQASRVLR